ncbi:uncharacterized protein LOC128501185 [Spea bombifrons]|uniref:uncharacterized protein LOC128501185 n=1 Tax=Spea bombifrons TaxID=233779 RepID=UPI00234A6972|nr:uncharacterized protein LOC128501185 [Spea bombifrons]
MDLEQQKSLIQNFSLDNCKLGNQGYRRVLLQLFGLPGNGKSSFINSCKFVLEGKYEQHAEARATDGGCTTSRIPHKLTEVILMVDNRGCPKLDSYERGEIFAQLGNLLPLNEEVKWVKDFKENTNRLIVEASKANYTDFIVPIFVHSIKNSIGQCEIKTYRDFLDNARKVTGINPIAVLTHKSSGNLTSLQSTMKDIGLDKIYAIENYTAEDHQKVLGKHQEILSFLCQILQEVNFCMESERNPERERNERTKFVVNYLKSADDEIRQQEIEERNREVRRLEERLKKENERGFLSRLFNF